MRNRLIYFILIICLAFGSINVYALDEKVDLSEQEKAVEILTAFEVLKDSPFEDMQIGEKITRGSFLNFFISLMYPTYKSTRTVSPFLDVATDAAEYDAICMAYEMGLISGDGNGYFSPAAYISYEEAIKMAVSLLGYGDMAERNGGYPIGYGYIANQQGIAKNLKREDSMTWGNCAVMILDCLEVPINESYWYATNKGVDVVYYREGDTLLYNVLEIRKGRGVVKANQYTTLTNNKDVKKKSIIIDDFKGKIYGGIQHELYFGYEVEYYYKVEDAGNAVLYLSPTKQNEVTKLSSEEIVGFDENGRDLTYLTGKKTKSMTIPGSASIIYNGEVKPDYTKADFEYDDAEYNLIDHDNDGKIDVVNITKWESIFVFSADFNNQKIADRYDRMKLLDLEKALDWVIWDEKFNEIELEDIKPNTILTYIKSESGIYLRGYVSERTITGVIDVVDTDSDGNQTVTIGDAEYEVLKSFLEGSSFMVEPGQTVVGYLDYAGKIAALELKESVSDYGYMIAARKDNGIEKDIIIKMLLGNSQVRVVTLASNAIIDGVSVKSMSEEEIFNIVGQPQIVNYLLNGKGEVKAIDTVSGGTDNKDNLLYELEKMGTLEYYSDGINPGVFVGSGKGTVFNSNQVWYAQMVLGPDTKVLVVPGDLENAKDEDFKVMGAKYFDRNKRHTLQGVSTNPNSFIPEAILVKVDSGSSEMDNPCLITDIYKAVSGDDIVTRIEVIEFINTKGVYDILDVDKAFPGKTLEVGDYIVFNKNSQGQIETIGRLYSQAYKGYDPTDPFIPNPDDPTVPYDPDEYFTENAYYGKEFTHRSGKIYNREGNIFAYTKSNYLDAVKPADLLYFTPTERCKVYVVENTGDGIAVRDGNLNDCYDYVHYGIGSDVFITLNHTVMLSIIIYR